MVFLAFTEHSIFKVYQMNVKCAFLNGELVEEVLCTTVPRLWISEYHGLCISSLQGSQQTRVS